MKLFIDKLLRKGIAKTGGAFLTEQMCLKQDITDVPDTLERAVKVISRVMALGGGGQP